MQPSSDLRRTLVALVTLLVLPRLR
jgi:hypothetical protein